MSKIIFKNVRLINENEILSKDVLIENHHISRIDDYISCQGKYEEVNGEGLDLIPGIIDDQVHFRDPGLTHKADLFTESCAAAAGGVTSYMEMPNTKPAALTQELLEQKYQMASKKSCTNYSFFMGTSNDNYEEVIRTNPKNVCGVKIFMGSSTGNMLVDDPNTLEKIFCSLDILVATHCEDEGTIRQNTALYSDKYGDKLEAHYHPIIRNETSCFISSSAAIAFAKKCNARLHVLHISTSDELTLFDNALPLREKKITSEVCVHHLFFDAGDYAKKGNLIKCNPAIKEASHKTALFNALLDDRLDIIATDHAPHTWDEKSLPYLQAPSGLPLVQHSLNVMLGFYHDGKISMEKIVQKMCHAPADCFRVEKRGYLREGYFADLVLLDRNKEWTVNKSNILYKCGWSPFEGHSMKGKVEGTWVNGQQVYDGQKVTPKENGMRLTFDR